MMVWLPWRPSRRGRQSRPHEGIKMAARKRVEAPTLESILWDLVLEARSIRGGPASYPELTDAIRRHRLRIENYVVDLIRKAPDWRGRGGL